MTEKPSYEELEKRNRELEQSLKELTGNGGAMSVSEGRLRQMQKMEALGSLVAGVAHEINNPINLIMFNVPLLQKIWNDFLPILKEQAIKDPGRTYGGLNYAFLFENLVKLLSDMDMAANRVAKIISDLKNFARQTDVTDKSPVQINVAVQNAMRLAKTTLNRSGITVTTDLAADLPLLEGNLQAIEQIILNLLINAIEAIDHDNGRVVIKTAFRKNDGGISLAVSDNGRGIDPSISNKIFDPFFTSKQVQGGIGMGLSISFSLIKAHKGEITFSSETGKGTVFDIYFPTAFEEKAIKILVVDDDPSIRNRIVEALTTEHPYLVDLRGIVGSFYIGYRIIHTIKCHIDICISYFRTQAVCNSDVDVKITSLQHLRLCEQRDTQRRLNSQCVLEFLHYAVVVIMTDRE